MPEVYQEYIHHKQGQAYIYYKLNVTLYGTLKEAFLFWKKLSASLKQSRFVINPYYWCIANKNIDGTQCTIAWHVDDLKLSHKCSAMLDEIITLIRAEYRRGQNDSEMRKDS